MPDQIWIDGKLVGKQHAVVSVFDHGLLYGDGVFEGLRAYHGRIFECDAHLARLRQSASAIRLAVPFSDDKLRDAMLQTMQACELSDCYLRVVITRGVGSLGIDPRRCEKPCVFVIAGQVAVYPREYYEHGINVVTAATVRNHPAAISPRIKSLNYLNNILARIEANDSGAQEAVMLNHLGHVAECTADNIFVVHGGRVSTPTPTCGILEGITRKVILELCHELKIPAAERQIEKHDLYIADECFVSGTGAEICPVSSIDGRSINSGKPGPITLQLLDAYHQRVRQQGE